MTSPAARSSASRPSLAASGTNGPSASSSSAPIAGTLTAFVDELALERRRDLLGHDDARAILGLLGGRGEVRRHDDVGSSSSGPEYGSSGRRRAQPPRPCPDVSASTSASSSTSSPRAALTIRTPSRICANASRADRAARLGVRAAGAASGSPRAASTSSSVSTRSTPSSRKRSVDDERVVRDDPHPEPGARRATGWPIRPKPSTPSVLSASSTPPQLRPLPAALLQRGVRLRDVARERDEEADRVLGRRDDVRLRRVRDDDSAPRRRVDVDVVDPDAGAADHLQPVAAVDQVRGRASSPSG